MRKTTGSAPLHHGLVMVFVALSSACTGTSSVPGGSGTPGSGNAPGGGTSSGGANSSGGGSAKGSGGHTGSTGSGSGGASSGSGSGSASGGATGSGTGGGSASGTSGTGGTGVSIGSVQPTNTLDPGRVVLRRLNVTEYNNTVRDLLGTAMVPGTTFPGDDVNDGFDTLGEALSFSDILGAQMEQAATNLVNELLGRPATDPIRTKILTCTPTAANLQTCLTTIMTAFMKNAYRRPATAAEVSDVVSLASSITTSSGDVNRGVNAAFKMVLLSPYFIFHVELGAPTDAAATPLNDYELASRLSYFLWSTMPDPTLMQAADATKLSPAGADLATQVDRMLTDPKSQAFIDNFVGQWLWSRQVSGVSPDPALFPSVDQALLDAIPKETSAFFKSLLTGGKPLTDLLLSTSTFVNTRLATHYGLPTTGLSATNFSQVSLANTPRTGGILTQETFLTTTSQPNRTSPVKRGEWILEQMLCDPPPSPPPNVPMLPTMVVGSGLSGRAYLEAHVQNAYCASCHNSIDPIGFTLENFDAIGAYRTMDNGQSIDASGVMPDGTSFNGPAEIAKWVANDPRFSRCVTKQMVTYAVGRSFDSPEALSYVAGMAGSMGGSATWTQLVHTVATSQAFLTRRGAQ